MDWYKKKYSASDVMFWTSIFSGGVFVLGGALGHLVGYDKGVKITKVAVQADLMEAVACGRIAPGPGAGEAVKAGVERAKQLRFAAAAAYAQNIAEILASRA